MSDKNAWKIYGEDDRLPSSCNVGKRLHKSADRGQKRVESQEEEEEEKRSPDSNVRVCKIAHLGLNDFGKKDFEKGKTAAAGGKTKCLFWRKTVASKRFRRRFPLHLHRKLGHFFSAFLKLWFVFVIFLQSGKEISILTRSRRLCWVRIC